ncbi:MAG: S41 family peptidase [Acidobacteriota bacterium]
MQASIRLVISCLACLLTLVTASLADAGPTWLRHPAISPDGSKIAFNYKGDIFVVDTSGGRATQLTTYTGYDYNAVWSHDGQTIAFASDRYGNFDVFTMPAVGGAVTRLTHHSRDDMPSDFTTDGTEVLFRSARLDPAASSNFPTSAQPELYAISVHGGLPRQLLSTPAIGARFDPSGRRLIYQDRTSYENDLRKHHESSATRDIWIYEMESGRHSRQTDHAGEDLSPRFDGEGGFFYLSAAAGTINVFHAKLDASGPGTQLTRFDTHPVRSLSVSRDGLLAFSWDGELYTLARKGAEPMKVPVTIRREQGDRTQSLHQVAGGASEMAVSPNEKEVLFVHRGDVFATSIETDVTKQVTATVEHERWLDVNEDGRTVVYASERDGSWNLYEATIQREEESFFFLSTLIEEKPLLTTAEDTYQPVYSPDGKKVAYLESRTTLKVLDRRTGRTRTVFAGDNAFSYGDGDQYFAWSPDSRWLFVEYQLPEYWFSEVGLVAADGSGEVTNLTDSGFHDYRPKWMVEGKMLLWFASRDGMRSFASTSQYQADAYAMFLTRESWDRFRLSEEEAELLAEAEEEEKDDDKKKSKRKNGAKRKAKKVDPIEIELEGVRDRRTRLTIHSSLLTDAVVTPDGETLLYLTTFEKGFDLWKTNLRTKETSILADLNGRGGSLTLDEKGQHVFVLAGGKMSRVEIGSGKSKPIAVAGELPVDRDAEWAYYFDHAWRWIQQKYYLPDMRGVDWKAYGESYRRHLPSIGHGRDWAELFSELLGELNVSHSGARFRDRHPDADQTASLGLYYDPDYEGDGLRVLEVMDKGPLDNAKSRVRPGTLIVGIDGIELLSGTNPYRLLNHRAGRNVLLTLRGRTGARWDEVVKPISLAQESQLAYERWAKRRRELTDSLSGGRLGYVHVRSMSDPSYRTVFEEALGAQATREGLVVDTRWNGGGDLVDDLSTFLDGDRYATFTTREGRILGGEPQRKWKRPSLVLINEGNYSDGHCFPYAYRTLGIGKTVGMPIAGTCSWVSGTSMTDGQTSVRTVHLTFDDRSGKPLENQQFEPDIKQRNEPGEAARGRDQQLERAVEELLRQLDTSR